MATQTRVPGNQLSLEIEATARRSYRRTPPLQERDSVPDFSQPQRHETPKRNVFHPEGSHIGYDRFALKISHLGQAYLIQGSYHATVERSFSDGTVYAVIVDRVSVDRIYLYRNGAYVFVPISKHVADRLSHVALEILKDPEHNRTLAERRAA
ncbi:MAG: hypothetical protein QG650_27 [Patescibacteria group bacterium]|nr:hypothetical protein [Patescibacteria group bacterium]